MRAFFLLVPLSNKSEHRRIIKQALCIKSFFTGIACKKSQFTEKIIKNGINQFFHVKIVESCIFTEKKH